MGFRLVPGSCADLGIAFLYKGSIEGEVTDELGKPLSGAILELFDADKTEHISITPTDERGHYRFEFVGPGKYAVGVNFERLPVGGRPSRGRFYPSATEFDAAEV